MVVLFNPYLEVGDEGVHTIPKDISSKVNIIARPEFELAYYDVTIQHVSHYAMERRTPFPLYVHSQS